MPIEIGNISIGRKSPPFIIAEMSGNHNQSLERALEIVKAAAASGAHALKLQTYTADTMTIDVKNNEFLIQDPKSLWKGEYLYSLYKKAYTPWEWHEPILKRANSHGMLCFSSPFDSSAVDFLESINFPCYKIASPECIDIPLIKKVSKTGKPIIISTGMASFKEIEEAVETARNNGCKDIALLKCTSAYPATPENSNLRTIADMRESFKCEVGISDHTLGIGAAITSVSFGATIIEKHFTLSRKEGGIDSAFSLEPDELAMLVNETKSAWKSIGNIYYGSSASERNTTLYRRSLYITEDLKAGDLLNKFNLRSIRPGFGLPPKYIDQLMGKPIIKSVKKGTPMTWDLLKK